MSKPNEPEVISLTHEQVDALKKRLLASPSINQTKKFLYPHYHLIFGYKLN